MNLLSKRIFSGIPISAMEGQRYCLWKN